MNEHPRENISFSETQKKHIIRVTKVLSRPEDIALARSFLSIPSDQNDYIDDQFIEAVYHFQSKNPSLKRDGIFGPATLQKMRGLMQSPKKPSNPGRVSHNQEVEEGSKGLLEKIPSEWQNIAKSAIVKMNTDDIKKIQEGSPFILVNSRVSLGFAMLGNATYRFPVTLGRGGVQNVADTSPRVLRGSGATGAGMLYEFNSVKIPNNPYDDASISGSLEDVVGASLISPQGIEGGGRWFHGVTDMSRKTAGCIGLPVPEVRLFAQAIKSQGKGYGYVG